jgi:hypothetical protein
VEKLRREFDQKHKENREEIHKIEEGQAVIREELAELKGRIDPYLDNGQPGLFSKMSAKLDAVLVQIGDLKIAQGEEKGRRDVYAWIRAVIGPLIVGLALLLAQHAWK